MRVSELDNFKRKFINTYDDDSMSEQASVEKQYLYFSKFFQKMFIGEDRYVISTGNYMTVNVVLLESMMYKIKKHPILFKLLIRLIGTI